MMEEIGPKEIVVNSEPRRSFFNAKRRVLFVYVPGFLAATLIFPFLFEEASNTLAFDLVTTVALNILVFAWIKAESRERGYELHRLFPYAVVIFGILALVYYLFRSRGFRGGLVSTGLFLLYAVLCVLAVMIVLLIIMVPLVLIGVLPEETFDP